MKISFEFENCKFTEESFLNDGDIIIINLNNVSIGSIEYFIDNYYKSVQISYMSLDKEYRRKGYGTLILEKLKSLAKKCGMKYIEGECRGELIQFYKRLGADFTKRRESDYEYINHRFYIDL